MGAKGNFIAGVLIVALAALFLALCSSTAIQDFIIDTVKGI